MAIQLQTPCGGLKNRDDMARRWCPGKVCAEVGVLYGSFSEFILAQKPKKLYMIDCWKHQPETVYPGDDANLPDAKGEETYRRILDKFGRLPNIGIVRDFSYDAAGQFMDGMLDFCFLDACHTTPMLLVDCAAWWPKVRPGGFLCGHDYNLGGVHEGQVHNALQHFLYVIHREKLDFVTEQQDSWGIRKS